MYKTLTSLTLVAVAAILIVSLPATGQAQTTTRKQNLEVNRDVRNIKLRATSTSTEARMEVRLVEKRAEARQIAEFRMANWAKGPNSPMRISSTTLFAKIASSSDLRDRAGWRDTSLEKFAFLHSNLISQTERSLKVIKDLRTRIAERITSAESRGRNMTDAKALLIKADEKILAAEVALKALVSYTPPAIASSTTQVSADAKVTLERPRIIGKAAIEAVKSAKEALQEVVRAIAQDMGLKKGQNATSTSATSTNP